MITNYLITIIIFLLLYYQILLIKDQKVEKTVKEVEEVKVMVGVDQDLLKIP